MKTDELIGILATGARPVAPHRLEQRFGDRQDTFALELGACTGAQLLHFLLE